MKKERTYLSLAIALGVVLLGIVASFVVLYLMKFIAEHSFLWFVYLGVTPIVAVGCAVFVIMYAHTVRINKEITVENEYNLGKPNHFFNYTEFTKRAKAIQKRCGKDMDSFITTFSTSHISMMKNSSRNPAVIELNGYIADFLTEYFVVTREIRLSNVAFCFYHGQFVLYIAGSEDRVREIIEIIESQIYKIVNDNSIKLFIQPFFGIAKMEPGQSLPMVLDNAFLARDLSEKNFDNITIYNSKFRKTATKSELQEIKEAIENNELVVYYQPKYNLASKTFISAEALVRWNSRKYGLVSPAKFIEKAELGGLIHELDMYVFKRVCEDLGEMKKDKKRFVPVSVNFSIYEFYSPTFLDDVDKIIKSTDINPSMVEIEITETTSQANPFLAINILKKLKEYGLKILMDDFGLGYSNLGTLNKVPFDTVKIDKSFIDGIVSDLKAREIVKFLTSLCKTNGMEVIAEGVDKPEQVEILKKIRCDTIQGFYYSEPLPRSEFEKFLDENPFEKKEAGE